METIFGIKPELKRISTVFFNLQSHPGGFAESIPIAIMSGSQDGPTISISANIHGDEYTGTLVLHELMRDKNLLNDLKGKIIILPSINPFGAAMCKRNYSFTDDDPNRSFPRKNSDEKVKNFTEISMEKVFQELKNFSQLHIDLHCSKLHSEPFIYTDPVFSEELKETEIKSTKAAREFGLFIVKDNRKNYFSDNYDKTFTGSLFNQGIPSFTVELGSKKVVDESKIKIGVNGIKNVLLHCGMISSHQKVKHNIKLDPVEDDFEVNLNPKMPESGIVKFLVQPGDYVNKDQPVATIRNIFGENIRDGYVYSNYSGYVLCKFEGAVFYIGKPILKLAVKIDQDSKI